MSKPITSRALLAADEQHFADRCARVLVSMVP